MKKSKKRGLALMRPRKSDTQYRTKSQQNNGFNLLVLFLVKLEIKNLSSEEILGRMRLHIMKLTGNADFPVVDPALTDLQSKADELEAAIDAAKSGAHNLIEHRNVVQGEAEDMIRSLAWDIQKKSGGDAEKIHSTGFETRDAKSPSELPAQVMNVSAKSTGEGKIKLRWDKVDSAIVYIVEGAQGVNPQPSPNPQPPLSWDAMGKSFKTSLVLTGLASGAMYYFQVYASNQVGDGERSEISNVRCL